ncbi:hypothetical protein DWV67_15340 [Dorea formicigenerans]|uniref:Uncharacterized protein n=1 Tax=Dorea formicigenerans TaxID=39486 RepID=A0A395XL69_9FIRM|nr:hypothetical protein DWV67_15340 [Dorea formicigenerans]
MRKKEKEHGVADDITFDIESENIDTKPDTTHITSTNSPKSAYATDEKEKKKRGRNSVSKEKRKIQFSLTCTPAQKKQFVEAAEKEQRTLPNFICRAVEEYIKNHNL